MKCLNKEQKILLIETIKKEKNELSKKWFELEKNLNFKALNNELENEEKGIEILKEEIYDKKLIDLFNQYEELKKNSNKEIESYLKVNPQRFNLFNEFINECKKSILKIKKNNINLNKFSQKQNDEDWELILNILNNNNINFSDFKLLTNDCLCLNGKIFFNGDNILVLTKSGTYLSAIISFINENEFFLLFKDNGRLLISKDEIFSGNIKLSQM